VNYFGEVELRWEIGCDGQSDGGAYDGGGDGSGSAVESMEKAVQRWRGNKGWEEVEVKRYA
jgi:hypothetical protein